MPRKIARSRRQIRTALGTERLESRNLMAVFTVNTLLDSTAVDLVSGVDSNGSISLRSAIMAANALGGSNTIVLQTPTFAETHLLTIAGRNEDSAATGDLDIRGRLTIEGNGAIISASDVDRVFDILSATNVTLNNLSIEAGQANEGGAIYNRGRLTLNSVNVFGTAIGDGAVSAKGGGIFNTRSGIIVGNASFVQGSANGPSAPNNPLNFGVPGNDGGSAAGGALYNLGQVTWNGGSFSGQIVAGDGGNGGEGLPGRDANGRVGATNGALGANGGRGGSATGGAIFNGSLASFQMTGGSIQGSALAGRGGDGGAGGKGGNAGIFPTVLSPGAAAPGGNGGAAGNALGGAIYNSGGTVTLNRGSNNLLRIGGRATAFAGGGGGPGGMGGDGASDFNELIVNGSNGANGGNGATGGSALGGSLYTVGGAVQLNGISIPNVGNDGVQAGNQSNRGSGGEAGLFYSGAGLRGANGAYGASGRAEGGALWVSGGTVTLSNSVIEGVDAVGGSSGAARGGVLAMSGGTVNIVQSNLVGNSARGGSSFQYTANGGAAFGGTVWMSNGALNISNSLVDNSTATGNSGAPGRLGISGGLGAGGAIAMTGGTAVITDTTISSGDAIGGPATSPTAVVNSQLQRGGSGGSAFGGGVYATGGSLTISGSTLNDNEARSSAGAAGHVGTPNGAGGSALGGGIYATGATVTINNTTIHGNSVDMLANGVQAGVARGGGIYHAGSAPLALNYVTVARNIAGSNTGATSALGAGIFNASGPVSLRNTLIVLNVIGSLLTTSQNDVSGTITSLGYNLVGVRNNTTNFVGVGDRWGSSNNPLNARLGLLADNGGPTKTCSLEIGSPAIDNGDPNISLTADQRGISRLTNGRSDIGAFEVIVQLQANRRAKR